MNLAADRAAARAPHAVGWQQPGFRRDFVQKLANGQRVPNFGSLVSKAGNEDRWRQQQDFRARGGVVRIDRDLLELDAGEFGHQPSAQGP